MVETRLRRLRERLAARKLDALLVTDIANVFYLSGFTGSTAALVVTSDRSCILVDPRYTLQAQAECANAEVVPYSGISTIEAAADHLRTLEIVVSGYESQNLTVASFRALRKRVGSGLSLRSTKGIVEQLRRVKDDHEISVIRTAAAIADAAFDAVLMELRAGMTEKDAALLIDMTLRKMGADKEGFDTIAACGPNSACPHARPTDAVLKTGQPLKLDFGARYKHYNSDITRTVSIGRPSAKLKEIHQIVLDAQARAIQAVAPGKRGREIDAVARDYIAAAGYGDHFGHGLGHAIGITVHDGPAFSSTSDVILEAGMVASVEPGIYIEGWGGVRIEDDVLVTQSGFEVLTKAPKGLLRI